MGKPIIRFQGYTDDWEQRKLGDVCEVTMGQSPDGSTYSDEPSDYILVQGNADLKDGWVVPRVWTSQKTKTAQAGDLIMSVRAPAGAMGKTAYDIVIGRGVAAIKGNEFIYQTLVKYDADGYWKKLAAGSTFESVNSNEVKGAIINVPQDIEEQKKIGEYFLNLDHLITLHQRKCDETKKLKKYMLQKMFPQNGQDVPEIRFEGFTDAWEQRKLGEVAKFRQGIQVNLEKQYTEEADNRERFIRIVDYTQGTNDIRYIDKIDNANYVDEKDVVVVRYGATAGFIGHGITGIIANNMFTINPSEELNKEFLYTYMKRDKMYNYLNLSNGSSAMPAINFGIMTSLNITYPSVAEQQKIGAYFSILDHLITLHQNKCEELKKLKKFMLQNMFV